MAHYICRGKKCKSISDRPSICLDASCEHRYKLLDECSCSSRDSHHKELEKKHSHYGGVEVITMGTSVGILLGAYLFFLGIAATYLGWGGALVANLSEIYVGYDATFAGALAGGFWGIVDGFVFGSIIAWIYNLLRRKLS